MKKKLLAITGVIGAICLVGGAYALFSGTAETKQNTFSIVPGQEQEVGAVEIIEPNWDASNAVNLEPGQLVAKDPYAKSKADYESYIVIAVTIPKVSGKVGTTDGKYETFSLVGLDTSNFELLDTDVNDARAIYYYGYKSVVTAKGQTTPLFTKIQVTNFSLLSSKVEGTVDVDAYMIQHINPETGAAFTSVNDAYTKIGKFVD